MTTLGLIDEPVAFFCSSSQGTSLNIAGNTGVSSPSEPLASVPQHHHR